MKNLFNDNCVKIFVDGIEENRERIPSGILKIISPYLDNEIIKIEHNYIVIPNMIVADMNIYQIRALELHPIFPFKISIKGEGKPTLKNYRINISFEDSRYNEVIFDEVNGVNIKLEGKQYTLTNPHYELVHAIVNLNNLSEKNIEKRLDAFHELRKIVPEDVILDDSIKDFDTIKADRFTLDLANPDKFEIVPEILSVKSSDDDNSCSLLPPSLSDELKDKFLKHNRVKKYYRVGSKQYVVLSDALVKALRVVKTVQSESIEKRRAFYLNPSERIHSLLEESFSEEELSEIFFEGTQYISDRISHLGEWSPKAGVYLPREGTPWVPEDCVCLKLGDYYNYIDPENIDDICKKVEEATVNGKKEIFIDGQAFPANNETLDILKSTKKRMNDFISEENKKDKQPKDSRPSKMVSIIKDNLDQLEYEKTEHTGRNLTPYIPSGLIIRSLYDYQKDGVSWLQSSFNISRPGVLLADDMGLGKTLQALTFLLWVREHMDKNTLKKEPILIIGPSGLLKNWQEEHDKHLEYPGLGRLVRAYGNDFRLLRKQSLNYVIETLIDADWVLTTYETLRDQEKYFRQIQWSVIVFDEVQKIKNPGSLATDMAKAMASRFSIALTGTPIENSLIDIWCIIDCIYPKKLSTLKEFKDCYIKEDNSKQLKGILLEEGPPPLMLRRMKDGQLKGLKKKYIHKIEERMPKEQADIYSHIIGKSQRGDYRGNPLQSIQDLRRFSLYTYQNMDFMKDDDINKSARLIGLIKILETVKMKDEKVLVFLENRKLQDLLIPYLKEKFSMSDYPALINGELTSERRSIVKENFQNRNDGFDILLISPKAGGVGLTITRANHVIHLERWWNPAVEDQATDRVYRIGQEKDVHVYCLMALHPQLGNDSFDAALDELLDSKRKVSRDVICTTELSKKDREELYRKVMHSDFPVHEVSEENFYMSPDWRALREKVFRNYSKICMKCGSKENIEVDHIKPRSKYRSLELEYENLQVLCKVCNLEKADKYSPEMDYRKNPIYFQD